MEKKILIYGGRRDLKFLNYIGRLTQKERPKICFLPTAVGDDERHIIYWYEQVSVLDVEPSVMRVWINSYSHDRSWEEILTSVDAIVVSGGNTLNMIAIWKAQGIDLALKKAYEKGIVLAGGSAGSICWFEGGTTDSRPKELSIVEGLKFLEYSHCPHYNSETSRRPLYHQNILEGKLSEGYACDDGAALIFIDGQLAKGIALDEENNSYFVRNVNGTIVEEQIQSELV